jgi:hypothetical protein
MLKLSSNCVFPLAECTEPESSLRRITDNPNYVRALRGNEYLLLRPGADAIPSGFAGYLPASFQSTHFYSTLIFATSLEGTSSE